jgi:hypothetical protein
MDYSNFYSQVGCTGLDFQEITSLKTSSRSTVHAVVVEEYLSDLKHILGRRLITRAATWWAKRLREVTTEERFQHKYEISKAFPTVWNELKNCSLSLDKSYLFECLVLDKVPGCDVCSRNIIRNFREGNPRNRRTLYCSHTCANRSEQKIASASKTAVATWERIAREQPEKFRQMFEAPVKWKTISTVDGRDLRLQGYEPMALRILENEGYKVWRPSTVVLYSDGLRNRRYYPDLAARRGNTKLMVEVKSPYTIRGCSKKLEAAYRDCSSRNIDFEVWLWLDRKQDPLRLKDPKTWNVWC